VLAVLGISTTKALAKQPACIASGVRAVRHQPSAIPATYRACAPTIAAYLRRSGISATQRYLRAAWAGAVSNRLAPYGSHPIATTFDNLRRLHRLEGAGYAVLAAEIYLRIGGRRSDLRTILNWKIAAANLRPAASSSTRPHRFRLTAIRRPRTRFEWRRKSPSSIYVVDQFDIVPAAGSHPIDRSRR
jgi:hypothetical protein